LASVVRQALYVGLVLTLKYPELLWLDLLPRNNIVLIEYKQALTS
jgi:hypothetical protein